MSVVVAYVPSATGFRALTESEREAQVRKTSLVVVNVVDSAGFNLPTAADEKDLDAVAAHAAELGIEHKIEQPTSDERPADVIVEIAHREAAELIVLGLHRRSRVQKALLGSTVRDVMLSAECPVLTVPFVEDARSAT